LIAGKSDRIAKPLSLSPKNAISQRLVRFAITSNIHLLMSHEKTISTQIQAIWV